jgi:hypothetical protein
MSNQQKIETQLYRFAVKAIESLHNPLYKAPSLNDINVPVLSFEEISRKLQNNEIEHFIIDSILQIWGNSQNRILTFYGKNGIIYLTKVCYNQQTNQIFPPV